MRDAVASLRVTLLPDLSTAPSCVIDLSVRSRGISSKSFTMDEERLNNLPPHAAKKHNFKTSAQKSLRLGELPI